MADWIHIKGENPLKIEPIEASPCSVECPLGTNVKAYVSLIAAGRFAEALEIVRQTNPFPGICGRVCPHPCEDTCRRSDLDDAVAIAALKRFIADYELRRGAVDSHQPFPKELEITEQRKKRIDRDKGRTETTTKKENPQNPVGTRLFPVLTAS